MDKTELLAVLHECRDFLSLSYSIATAEKPWPEMLGCIERVEKAIAHLESPPARVIPPGGWVADVR